jgi:nucleotide-binding universal stress UspA family protein
MALAIKPGWSKPSTILFASEFPADEKAFGFALALASEFRAEMIILHAFGCLDTAVPGALERCYDCDTARDEEQHLEHLAQRARNIGIHSKIVIRPGLAADQILAFLREQKIDRVVMGAHSPGPIGKLLVGSVAEAVLRNATVPVNIVGPEVIRDAYRHSAGRTILCSVGKHQSSIVVAHFAAELAATHNARLILQNVIPHQESAEHLAGRSLDQIEAELPSLIPPGLQQKIEVKTRVVLGDPTEELLYQGRAQRACMIVMGAHDASRFAAITRAGIVYKVLAYAQCPVVTLSPVVLSECGARVVHPRISEHCMAGVF